MGPHLHLNVFTGGMLLSSGLRLEGRMGSRAKTTNVVVYLPDYSTEVVKPNRGSLAEWSISCLLTAELPEKHTLKPEDFSVG